MMEMSRESLRKLAGWLLAAYWGVLFVLTHTPLPNLPVPGGSDKVVHLVAYFGLQFLLLVWLEFGRKLNRRNWSLAIIIIWAYGILDEILQPYVNRHCDIWDCVADWCGSIVESQ